MTRYLVLVGALALASTHVASTAQAQSVPNISGVKQTTNRAVAKTNAHTLAMTNVDSAKAAAGSTTSTGSSSTAASKRPVESPDTARGRGVRATVAGSATRA